MFGRVVPGSITITCATVILAALPVFHHNLLDVATMAEHPACACRPLSHERSRDTAWD